MRHGVRGGHAVFSLHMRYGWRVLAALFVLPLMAWGETSEDCLACHSDSSLSMQKDGRTVSLYADSGALKRSAHASLSCVDCHAGLDATNTPHAKVIPPVDCRACHDINGYDKSVHGRPREAATGVTPGAVAARCIDCHGTHEILPASNGKATTNRALLSDTCSKCHATEAEHYSLSAHGKALKAGIKGAPSCVGCHGEHRVESVQSSESPVSKTHEVKMCLKCHLDNPEVRERVALSAGFIQSYETSVHGVALASGNQKSASCSDCHGAHDMRRAGDVGSHVDKLAVAQACAQCHAEIVATFNESIHGVALKSGNQDSPSCTDCHGEHQILAPKDPRSRVAAQNVSVQVCAGCHGSVQLSQKYGLPEERFKSFSDSYHGLASKGGAAAVANCASCHGVHNIRPSSDSKSTISKDNLVATCGRCHPGANNNFAHGSVHVIMERDSSAVLYWIRFIYILLIIGTIGGMLAHNGLDFFRKARQRMCIRRGLVAAPHHGTAEYERMTLSERIQHALLFTSFFVLVITGFMLKFPDAWWVAPLRDISEKVFAVRSITHRIAGTVMVLVGIYHIGYLILTARGRRLAIDMFPNFKDIRDVIGMTLYNLGLSKTKPMFDRFSYIEKSEYWALMWGTFVMAGTGFIMWFDNVFIGLLTKLGWDIARTIHYYEAWLATLAILVWHLYFVMFSLDIYPMKITWFTGKISEEEMAEEHPLELQRLKGESIEPPKPEEPKAE